MKKALIYHDFPDELSNKLTKEFKDISFIVCKTKEEMLQNIGDTDILITFQCTREMLEMARNLKFLQVLSAGVETLPLSYIKERGITLANGRGIHKIQMSEYAIWAMISLARNTQTMAENQLSGKWDKNVVQGEIFGSTVGILGLGSIGREIARKASAFGMHVIGIKGTPENVDYVDKVYDESGITEVFKESDYIINLLPYTSKTDKMIDKSFFSLMKDTACFINIGRGGTVNEDDLIEALQSKKIRAAVCDVFYEEPLPEESPLWKMDNIIITPHICGVSTKYIEKSMEIIEHNLKALIDGGKIINVVDFEKGY
jgi:Phosphoglycerate dehydrogenase and related dehydrogenases